MNKITIFDNYYSSERFEEVKQKIFDNDDGENYSRLDDISDSAVFEEMNFLEEIDFDDALTALKKFFEFETVIFAGTVGSWDGRYSGGKIGEFEDLFYKAMTDYDYIKIYDEGGHLYIKGSHHDGTNIFEVKILTEAGYNRYDKWDYGWGTDETEEEIHNKLMNNSHYTHVPHFVKVVYGCNCR